MPVRSAGTVGEIPAELTSFVGRRREVDQVKRRLSGARLVTLTGVGGAGKTRLALRVATQLRRAFPDGAWFVDLTQLQQPGSLTAEVQTGETLACLVAATLGVRGPEREPLALVVQHLADRSALLVLDNCEHVMAAASVLAEALLRDCPGLRILATSREPLALSGETLFPVEPLPVPDPRQRLSPSDAVRCESVALFLARGQVAAQGFHLTADNQTAVAGICHSLDGLPLAIELTVPRLRILTPQQILDRLDRRFAVVSRGTRTAPERQQTLRACVNWSFDLCSEQERLLWARLSVFAGGFDLEAVEGICADDALPAEKLLDLLTGLVDKSIVVRDDLAGSARYRMLMTISHYGLLKLRQSGEESTLGARHAQWYLHQTEQAEREWFGPDQVEVCRRMQREHANQRAAFDFFLSDPDSRHRAMRLAAALWFYWLVFGQVPEGRDWLHRAATAAKPTKDQAKGLWVHGHLASVQGDLDTAVRLLAQAEELARELGDPLTQARAAKRLGAVAMHSGDLPRAETLLVDALARLEILDETGASTVHAQVVLALTRFLRGDLAGAVELGDRTRSSCQLRGDQYLLAYTLNVLARAEFALGRLQSAAAHARQAVWVRHTLPDSMTLMFSLDLLSWITAAAGDHERAATLAGAAGKIWQSFGPSIRRWQFLAESHEEWEKRIRAALGETAYQVALHRGAHLSIEDIISYAVGEETTPTCAPKAVTDKPHTVLTRREMEIADLVAQSLSNKQIAAKLVISQRTAEGHVERILQKLGFSSRVQIVTWLHETEAGTRGHPLGP
jgi:predicted ATPase/DNA-binding CsgD family transcriptional regulator